MYILHKKNMFLLLSTLMLFLTSFMGCLMIFIRKFIIGEAWYSFLIWNLFLSWIPYILSVVLYIVFYKKRIKIKKILFFLLGIMWIVFYPNSPYMVTDFIHIKNFDSVLMWYDFIVFSLFIFTSFFMGFISLFIVFKILKNIYNSYISFLIIFAILFLTSYGIYLGRVTRRNSWDLIFNYKILIQTIIDSININCIIFSIVLVCFLF
jgi:uncharacterized membrane protein